MKYLFSFLNWTINSNIISKCKSPQKWDQSGLFLLYLVCQFGFHFGFIFFKFVRIWIEIYFWKVQFSRRVIIMTNASITGNFLSAFGVSTRSRKRRWRKLKEKTNSSIKTNNTHKQTIYFKKENSLTNQSTRQNTKT